MSRAKRGSKRPDAFQASEPARKAAAAVLQVVAGIKTPLEACQAIGLSVNRYYQLETRALAAMVRALEPLPRGRRRKPEAEIERLLREKAKVEREASRYQALWRAGQRALGLAPPPTKRGDSKAVPASGKKPRRPRMRAKALIAALEAAPPTASPQESLVAGSGGTP